MAKFWVTRSRLVSEVTLVEAPTKEEALELATGVDGIEYEWDACDKDVGDWDEYDVERE